MAIYHGHINFIPGPLKNMVVTIKMRNATIEKIMIVWMASLFVAAYLRFMNV